MTIEPINDSEKELLEGLAEARTAVRSQVTFVKGEIVDLYETGRDKNDQTLIQPLEIKIKDKIRRYVIRGENAIKTVFGDFDKNTKKFSKIKYKDDLPIEMSVPDCKPDSKNTYWWGLKKI